MTLVIHRHDDVAQLHMTSVGSRAVRMSVSAYVVRGILIDTGFHHVRDAVWTATQELGVRGVIVTHWHEDHAGNVPMLAARGMAIGLRSDTEATLRARPEIKLYRRVVWGRPPALAHGIRPVEEPSLIRIHTPGHSSDHQVVWDRKTGTLFSGDLWLGVRARILHASEDPYQIIESLRAVQRLSPLRMFDAHRGLVDNPRDAIAAKITWLGETLSAIERALLAGSSEKEIVRGLLGGEETAAYLSGGDYSRTNLVKAVQRRISSRFN